MKVPKVAVVVCTYNMVKYLPEALDSVLSLRYPNMEIVVVNDGSTDATEDIIRSKYTDKITYVYQENRGLFAARNSGIEAVHDAEYYSIVDADDIVHPLKLWDEVAFLERHPKVVVCFSQIIKFRKTPVYTGLIWNPSTLIDSNELYGQVDNCIDRIVNYYAFTSVSTIRASALRAIGNCDEKLAYAGDLDLAIRLSRVGGIGFINKTRYLYRYEGQGMTEYSRDYIVHIMRIFDNVRKTSSGFSDKELQLLFQMEHRFLKQAFWRTGVGTVNIELREDIERRLFNDVSINEKVKLVIMKCLIKAGLAKSISYLRSKRYRRAGHDNPSDLQEILNDMSPCFDSIMPQE